MVQKIITKAATEVISTIAEATAKKGLKTTPVFQTKVTESLGDTIQLSKVSASGGNRPPIDHITERVRYIVKNRLNKLPNGSRMLEPSSVIVQADNLAVHMAYQVDKSDANKIKIVLKDAIDRGDWDEAVPYRTSLEMILDKNGQMNWGRLFEGEDLKWYSKDLPCATEFVRSDKNKRCMTLGTVNYRPISNSNTWAVVENTVSSREQAVTLAQSEHPFSKLFFELAGLKSTLS